MAPKKLNLKSPEVLPMDEKKACQQQQQGSSGTALDSDVEMQDADNMDVLSKMSVTSSHRDTNSHVTSNNNTHDTNSDDDNDESDEESALGRLSGMYRRYSENHGRRHIDEDVGPTLEASEDTHGTQIQQRVVSENRDFDDDDHGSVGDHFASHILGSMLLAGRNRNGGVSDRGLQQTLQALAERHGLDDGAIESDNDEETGNHSNHDYGDDDDDSQNNNNAEDSDDHHDEDDNEDEDEDDEENENENSDDERNVIGNFRNALNTLFPGTGFGEMLGAQSRIPKLIENLETEQDPFIILETLNELSERLLMMTGIVAERSLSSYKLSKALVALMNNPFYQEDLELQLVACRCLYNLMEAYSDSVSDVVSAGAIEALQAKLLEISYIDLAEQALQSLEMISRQCGREIMRKGCLPSCVMYLDFFTIHAQREALSIVAKSCENIPKSRISDLKEVFPVIERVATESNDKACAENAWIAIAQIIKSFESEPDTLEGLLNENLLKRLSVLLPSSLGKGKQGTRIMSFSTCVKLLNSLSSVSMVSPVLSVMLLKNCDLGTTINASLNAYKKSDVDRLQSESASDVNLPAQINNDNNVQPSVSIDALMAAPKDLVVSFVKLIGANLPFDVFDESTENLLDVGNFKGYRNNAARKAMNSKRIELYDSPDNSAAFKRFIGEIFPLLLKNCLPLLFILQPSPHFWPLLLFKENVFCWD
ncbi:unnamed protein product [Ambrosiozyma monospora]|uniref:HECT-type E3 ubiquitin transferase n=1 Tax=Ambrosiozyma monospora TaxID=43982 RepID=A0A9W6YWC5_AMBMO|nr:unnamed protein product [Ambrosiozyma monospora]